MTGALVALDLMKAGTVWKPDDAFEKLVSHSAPVFWVFFLLTGLSLFVLRIKDRHLTRPFSVPLFPLLPLVFCAMCGYMLYKSIEYVKWGSLFGLGVLALGVPLYLISGKRPAPGPAWPTAGVTVNGAAAGAESDRIRQGEPPL